MIIGAHSVIYSTSPDADRAFLRETLKLPNVDVGGGWLIFGLPPAEMAVHPSDKNDVHEFYLRCRGIHHGDERARHCGEPRAGRGLGHSHAADAAEWRQARRLSATARTAECDERMKSPANERTALRRNCPLGREACAAGGS
jgi:hypothetical protein